MINPYFCKFNLINFNSFKINLLISRRRQPLPRLRLECDKNVS